MRAFTDLTSAQPCRARSEIAENELLCGALRPRWVRTSDREKGTMKIAEENNASLSCASGVFFKVAGHFSE